jgi:hypothetical protein
MMETAYTPLIPRGDVKEDQRYFMYGFKVFRSVVLVRRDDFAWRFRAFDIRSSVAKLCDRKNEQIASTYPQELAPHHRCQIVARWPGYITNMCGYNFRKGQRPTH